MTRSILVLLALSLTLIGCGSVPPAPVDRFYRLQPVSLTDKAFPAGLTVLPFQADSLYAERPLVYGEEANPRQLRQYHYHLWFYAPAQLVQEHLRASLAKAAANEKGARLEGRILRFDRMLQGKGSKAVVTLELRLSAGSKLLLSRNYTAEQVASDDSVVAFVTAMEQALARIYGDFLRDAATAG